MRDEVTALLFHFQGLEWQEFGAGEVLDLYLNFCNRCCRCSVCFYFFLQGCADSNSLLVECVCLFTLRTRLWLPGFFFAGAYMGCAAGPSFPTMPLPSNGTLVIHWRRTWKFRSTESTVSTTVSMWSGTLPMAQLPADKIPETPGTKNILPFGLSMSSFHILLRLWRTVF